jgi:hypothetical protein
MPQASDLHIGLPQGSGFSHAVAAEAHEHAARAHRLAAEQFASGNFGAALEFAQQAVAQAHSADMLSVNAQDWTREKPPAKSQ